jgi:hypothetical protein
MGVKRIFFLLKQSRPEVKKLSVWFFNGQAFCYHLKTGPKKYPENDHGKTGRSGFELLTVLLVLLSS